MLKKAMDDLIDEGRVVIVDAGRSKILVLKDMPT